MGKKYDGRTARVVEGAFQSILDAFELNRPGTKETPKRVGKMFLELLEGEQYTNEEIANMFSKSFDCSNDNLVVEANIPAFSLCEHHVMLMYNMKVSVGYIPKGKVLGLSKIARIVEMCSRRLQLQEKLGEDIAECIKIATGSEDVMVYIEAEHGCMTARGIKKPGTVTKSAAVHGKFTTSPEVRSEFYSIIKEG